MDENRDFIQCLGQDMSLKILMYLEDPCDFVRTSAVSRSWRQFVIANALCKKLCLRMFPEASGFARVVEIKDIVEPLAVRTEYSADWLYLEREHRVYASFCRDLIASRIDNCISDAICASSTDNYPEESIKNTLEPSDRRIGRRASYWSSKGENNPSAPETLIYKLASKLCLIAEVHVHPFQAYFQYGFPIYSAMDVRFQIGHPKAPLEVYADGGHEFLDVKDFSSDKFVWTYSSPEFPMAQENCLQKFKLPEPVLCIGGVLRVELLGRVQTREMDELYYICINHVQAVGAPLSPVFDVEMIDEQGKWTLKYDPERICNSPTAEIGEAESSRRSQFHRFSESIRSWEQLIVSTFRRAGPLMEEDQDSDTDYGDLDFL